MVTILVSTRITFLTLLENSVILDDTRITFLDEKSNSRCWSMTKLWSVPTSFKEKLSDLEKLFIWSLIQAIGSGPCSCFLQSWLFIFQLFLVVCIFRSKLGVDDTALFQRHRQFEETFENAQWRKVNQMQPMWLCFVLCKRFEETFENTQWGKVKQMRLTNEFYWFYLWGELTEN